MSKITFEGDCVALVAQSLFGACAEVFEAAVARARSGDRCSVGERMTREAFDACGACAKQLPGGWPSAFRALADDARRGLRSAAAWREAECASRVRAGDMGARLVGLRDTEGR